MFSSFFNYGITTWGLAYPSYLNPLYLTQKKTVTCLNFPPSAPIFLSLKMLKVDDLLHLNILTFVYKSLNNLSPTCIHNLRFTTTSHQTQPFTGLELFEQLEVTFSNLLKIPLHMVCKQFSTLVLNFGILSNYSFVLISLFRILIKTKGIFH